MLYATLCLLARRIRQLSEEIQDLEGRLTVRMYVSVLRRGLTQRLTDSGSSTGSVGSVRGTLVRIRQAGGRDFIRAWPEAPSLSCPPSRPTGAIPPGRMDRTAHPTTAQHEVEVTGGVDTHKGTHTAAAIDSAGRVLGSAQFPAFALGYRKLLAWLKSFGVLLVVGVEGTGAYGAGLARYLRECDVAVVGVDRPDRKTRRWQGKSDLVDAEAAARAALAERRTGTPKFRDGRVEALRALRGARRSAVQQRSDVTRQIKNLIVTAPEGVRTMLRHLKDKDLLTICAGFRPSLDQADDPVTATKIALRSPATTATWARRSTNWTS
ncbi:hypothetical protein GCM10010389_27280 [Streptomyces echinoruber]|uniref:Transposase IS110-like N-terminal domain-containing protein n=1 Tax=Streptomyces echinoruber TaxID=68898 RepID=A0A918R6W0_9ACTN|nr:hypothetical protein GCM10010389_27280 [Streptomyces echinoruber]